MDSLQSSVDAVENLAVQRFYFDLCLITNLLEFKFESFDAYPNGCYLLTTWVHGPLPAENLVPC